MNKGFWTKVMMAAVGAGALLAGAAGAGGVTIGDITRVEGQRINKLHGLGLVVGLKGTGDGGQFLPAMRPLAAMLQRLSDPIISPLELKDAKNVAIVTVTATLPEGGVRKGDRLDVQVQSIGSSKTLAGGRLFITPLQGPQRNSIVYALAEGQIRLEDPAVPTNGVVDGGAVLEEEVLTEFVENNKFRLVLSEASSGFTMAATVASVVNQDAEYEVGRSIAKALDARTVEVEVPEAYRANAVPFLGRVQRLDLIMPRRQAKVEVNDRTGTIVITGDVEISPTVVSHKSLVVSTQVTTAAPAAATQAVAATATANATASTGATQAAAAPVAAPLVQDGPFFTMDPQGEGGARLQDLVAALNVLKVPPEDRIAIVKLLARAGQIHAEVVFTE